MTPTHGGGAFPDPVSELDQPLARLLGRTTADQLARQLSVSTIGQLLDHFPVVRLVEEGPQARRHHRTDVVDLQQLRLGGHGAGAAILDLDDRHGRQPKAAAGLGKALQVIGDQRRLGAGLQPPHGGDVDPHEGGSVLRLIA